MPKKEKKRNEIRVLDIPGRLFKEITENSDRNNRSMGAEVLSFLQCNYGVAPFTEDIEENISLAQAQQTIKGNKMSREETIAFILKKYREI